MSESFCTQDRILGYVLVSGDINTFLEIKPQYIFMPENKVIYKSIQMSINSNKEIDKNFIITGINNSSGDKTKKLSVIHQIQRITSSIMVKPMKWQKKFIDEHGDFHIKKFQVLSRSQDLTTDNKIKELKKVFNEVCLKQEYESTNISDVIEEYRKKLQSGDVEDVLKNAIEVTDPLLKILIGDYFHPKPFCFSAKPGGYKTSTILKIMLDFVKLNKKLVYFSFEDTLEDVRNKLLAIDLRIPKNKMLSRDPSDIDFVLSKLNGYKLGPGSITVFSNWMVPDEFSNAIRREHMKGNCDAVFLDYAQLFQQEPGKNEYETITAVSKVILRACHELKIPAIYTSQLNDNNDVKGSRALHEHARYLVKIMDSENGPDTRQWNIVKTTWGKPKECAVEYNGQTGEMLSVALITNPDDLRETLKDNGLWTKDKK